MATLQDVLEWNATVAPDMRVNLRCLEGAAGNDRCSSQRDWPSNFCAAHRNSGHARLLDKATAILVAENVERMKQSFLDLIGDGGKNG